MKRRTFGARYVSTETPISGGGGEVFICNDPNLDRQVAIKFLLDGVDKARLLDEITALQRIRSKNVVQILDLVEDPEKGLGIVAEFLPGDDLETAVVDTTDRLELLRIVYQLANGLSDIHSAGIVHRDLKPNNVKYGDENILKIFDFNLARDEEKARTVGFRGTYGFAAPEQHGRGAVHLTSKADVYALGATIAAVVLGDLPPALRSVPPRPSEWSGGFSALGMFDNALASLLDATLSMNPDHRPTASTICRMAGSLLRRDGHRATITVRGVDTIYQLDARNRVAQIAHSRTGGGVVEVQYDGLGFVVTTVSGTVLVNRLACTVGQQLPDSCVIDLGSPSGRLSERLFVTFDLSHPEVVQ